MINLIRWYLFYGILISVAASSSSSASSTDRIDLYKIEGQIIFPPDKDVLDNIRILVDEGQYVGIPRVDGTFVISGIPSGSYIVSVNSPFHIFEPVRVDISTKGKIRAPKVDFIPPNNVVTMKYPLRFEVHSEPNYFRKHEVYRLTDIILNPMILPIIGIIIFLLFLPKLAPQGQDAQEVFQQTNNLFQPNFALPDISDFFVKYFGGPKRLRSTSEQSIDNDKTGSNDTQKKNKIQTSIK